MKFPYFLRPEQIEALNALNKNDHLIYVAPTGSGKSILFQKYINDHPLIRAVLISPLNALSRQQVERFAALGIRTFFNESPNLNECGVWILSPEKVHGKNFELLKYWKPNFLIVDEAHCIWEWGSRFRPAYFKILELVKLPSIQKSLWCSATLPSNSKFELEKILSKLALNKVKNLGKFGLPEKLKIFTEKVPPEIRLSWLRNKLGLYADQSGMVFCNTRIAAEQVQKYLQEWGINSFYYHAGLSIEEKLNLEKKLKLQKENSSPVVVVATSAFGMGMDYSFFQFCIIFEPPFSILSLVQAVGRIGRASPSYFKNNARAHVLWHPADFSHNQAWIDQTEVFNWCRSLENPVTNLENYFNGVELSGTIMGDGKSRDYSNRTSSIS